MSQFFKAKTYSTRSQNPTHIHRSRPFPRRTLSQDNAGMDHATEASPSIFQIFFLTIGLGRLTIYSQIKVNPAPFDF